MTSLGSLYLIRHGHTAGNKVRYVGWGDEPLDFIGRAQVRALIRRLADQPIDVVYSSPLRRALQTAGPVAMGHGVPVLERDGLREIDYGVFQDDRKEERKLGVKRNFRRRRMPGGESLRDVYDRVGAVRAEVEGELRAGRHVAVVGHFWSLRMLAGQLDGLPFDEIVARKHYAPENGVVTSRFGLRAR
jgi:probable phosphoglycerate mutase